MIHVFQLFIFLEGNAIGTDSGAMVDWNYWTK